MKWQMPARYLVGYLVGFSVFVCGLPYGLYLVSRAFPGPDVLPDPLRLGLALLLGLPGLVFALWSNEALVLLGQGGPTDLFNVEISPRTKNLVVTGPYRFTRNPMVFGVNSCYLALTIYWNSLAALATAIMFLMLIILYLKSFEEKRLMQDFGLEYEAYRQRVPMIIPWPRHRRTGR